MIPSKSFELFAGTYVPEVCINDSTAAEKPNQGKRGKDQGDGVIQEKSNFLRF